MKKFIVHPQYELVQDLNNGYNDNKWVIKLDSVISFAKIGIYIKFNLLEKNEITWEFKTSKDANICYKSLLKL